MTGDAVRIAAVIPAYNREHTVARAIRSALEQQLPPCEVIVVDDGSTDGTAETVRSFGDAVRHVRQENAGGAAARNRGAEEAGAEWIAFLDSDDAWTPSHLAAMAAAIEGTGGRADFYFADQERTEQGGRRQWELARFEIEGDWQMISDGAAWTARPRMPMFLQASVFHRGRFLAKGGLWGPLRRRHDTHGFLLHGVGHPICAVRNVGTVMTGDDETEFRLSTAMDEVSRGYLEYSLMLWRDALAKLPQLERPRRALLRHRLARAHLELARTEGRERHWIRGLRQALLALATRPATVLAALRGNARSEWELFPELR